jgi:NAD-dependent SIR2 family protein deacetylase
MNRIEEAQKLGCVHCLSQKKDFTQSINEDNSLVLKCNECGTEHYEDGFKFSVSVGEFKEKTVSWNSYQDVQKIRDEEEAIHAPMPSTEDGGRRS